MRKIETNKMKTKLAGWKIAVIAISCVVAVAAVVVPIAIFVPSGNAPSTNNKKVGVETGTDKSNNVGNNTLIGTWYSENSQYNLHDVGRSDSNLEESFDAKLSYTISEISGGYEITGVVAEDNGTSVGSLYETLVIPQAITKNNVRCEIVSFAPTEGNFDFPNLGTIVLQSNIFSFKVGPAIWNGSPKLKNVLVTQENEYFEDKEGVLLKNNGGSFNEIMFYPKNRSASTYEMPSSIEALSSRAFVNCDNLLSVTLSSNLIRTRGNDNEGGDLVDDYIGYGSFYDCDGLVSITIPKSVEEIGDGAFYKCSSLKHVTFEVDSKCKRIGHRAFSESALERFTLPSGINKTGYRMLYDCASLESVTYDCGNVLLQTSGGFVLNTIGVEAFGNCPNFHVGILLGEYSFQAANTIISLFYHMQLTIKVPASELAEWNSWKESTNEARFFTFVADE